MSKKKNGSDFPWWLVLVMFCIQPVLGVLALFLKLFLENGGDKLLKSGTTPKRLNRPQGGMPGMGFDPEDWRRHVQTPYGTPGHTPPPPPRPTGSQTPPPPRQAQTVTTARPTAAQTVSRPAASPSAANPSSTQTTTVKSNRSPSGKPLPDYSGATALKVLGIIPLCISGILSIIGTGLFFSNVGLSWPLVWVSIGFAIPGAVMLLLGRNLRRRNGLWRRLIQLIGKNRQVPIPRLAMFTGVEEEDVERALEQLIAEGYFDEAYIDRDNHLFVLGNPFTQTEEDRQTAQTLRTAATGKDALTPPSQKIRALNDRIAHPQVSQKLYRLEDLTEKIYSYVDRRPSRKEKLRAFEDYYLPNTLKILEAYANFEHQGISGSNIDATMNDIEEVLDTLVAGFEKTLDNLLADEALDISAEITVLENMLSRDGVGGIGFDDMRKKNNS